MKFQQMEGLKEYASTKEVLMELPLDLILFSVFLAVVPIIALYLMKKPFVRSGLNKTASYGFGAAGDLINYRRGREVNEKVRTNYTVIKGSKKIGWKAYAVLGYYTLTGLITFLMLKKTLFFGLIISQSMLPVLFPSDLVLIQSLDTQTLDVGDIIMFNPPGQKQPYIHRIVGSKNGEITTKGDNVGIPDSWVLTRKDVKGKAVTINDQPVKITKIGLYFMPRKTYVPGSDPTYDLIQKTVQTVHKEGYVFLVPIFVLMLLGFMGKKRKYW